MQHHDRRAIGVPALLNIDLMTIANIQHPLIKRVDRRKQMRCCALLA
jgi:hypothetical protein